MFFGCSYIYFLFVVFLTGFLTVLVFVFGGVSILPDLIFDINSPGLLENDVVIFKIPFKISGEFKPASPYINALYNELISNCSNINQANNEVIIADKMFLIIPLPLISSDEPDVINLATIPAAPINNTTQPPFKNSGIKSFKFLKLFFFI